MGAAAIANVLIYQWPVYYMARVRPPLESSTFAVYLQLILLVLSLSVSVAQPLWPAVADAAGRGDWVWIAKVLRNARAVALACGVCGLFAMGLAMNVILRLWLHRTIHAKPLACWLAGGYVLLATWEYVHWPLALGLGAMRTASGLVFWRAVAFAVSVPLVISYGTTGLMAALCTSVIAISAWLYPVLLARIVAARMPARAGSEMIRLAIGISGPPAPQF
jgi:O-antigen/teichoic acid export membrane protein